jgi:hypothetical protein
MSEAHAFCSPSDWKGWSNCAGKPALEETEPDVTNPAAAEGQHAHVVSAFMLKGFSINEDMSLPDHMVEPVNLYVNATKERVKAYELAGAMRVELLVEQKLGITEITGEKNAFGTADSIIVANFADYSVLEMRDAKFGRGVPVGVTDNGQLVIYALSALRKYSLLNEFREVILVIHQPRIKKEPQEWRLTPAELESWAPTVWEKAQAALALRGTTEALENLTVGEEQCRFCRAKYRCPAFARSVEETVIAKTPDKNGLSGALVQSDPDLLSMQMQRVPMIEQWCLAVRAAVESKLLAAEDIPGFKLVMGRAGPRAWSDEDAAMKLLLADGQSPDKILTPRKLQSPTQLEKVIGKAPIWEVVSETLIKRSEGKPSVAPADDPRPPYLPDVAGDFDTYGSAADIA